MKAGVHLDSIIFSSEENSIWKLPQYHLQRA